MAFMLDFSKIESGKYELILDDYDMPMKNMSGGQRKRVALAAVMAGDNNLLILDELLNLDKLQEQH